MVAIGARQRPVKWYSGRQLARFIWEWLDRDSESAKSYTYQTIQQLTWWGDGQVADWRDLWTSMRDEARDQLPETEWRDFLAVKLQASKVFEIELRGYARQKQVKIFDFTNQNYNSI